jgi:hypothetical protein
VTAGSRADERAQFLVGETLPSSTTMRPGRALRG